MYALSIPNSHLQRRPTERVDFLLPYLLTAFHDPIDGVAPRLVHLAKAFNTSERLFHPVSSRRWPILVELTSARVKDASYSLAKMMAMREGALTGI